jgi:hypothetical protein
MNRRALGTVPAMARTAAVLGAAAILALGGFAALPDDEPEYLGDMPSTLEQPAPAGAAVPRSDPGPGAGGPPPPLRGPSPVVPEQPAAGGAAPGERVPDPVGDTTLDVEGGRTAGDDSVPAPGPGLPDLFAGIVDTVGELTDCLVDGLLRLPDGGILDCVTGLPVPPLPTPPVETPALPALPVEVP